MKAITLILLSVTLCISHAEAQEFIPLNDDDLTRLGIVVAPVAALDRHSGNEFPAAVITSPDLVSLVTVPYAGVVEKWAVVPGQKVARGTALASIRSQELLEIQNQWLNALAEQQRSESALTRDNRLFAQGIVSELRRMNTLLQYEQIKNTVHGLLTRLQNAGFEPDNLASLLTRKSEFGLYVLRSPVEGILTRRAFVTGEYASRFSTLASLQALGQPWLSLRVPARIGLTLNVGHKLTIGGSDETLTVRQKDLIVDETTQTIEILAEFDMSADYMPGQVLTVIVPPSNGGISIPAQAVVHNGSDTVVYVQSRQGMEARALNLQPAGNKYVARSGIQAGELIVIQGASLLKGMQLGLGSDE